MDTNFSLYPVVVEQNVTWGDMDAHGHVNNVEYFRYMENARVEFYRRIGKYDFEKESGVTLVLKSTTCHFLGALAYPDKIAIGARIREITDDQIVMEYAVVHAVKNKAAALGEATIVAVNMQTHVKVPIPDELKRRMLSIRQEKPSGI